MKYTFLLASIAVLFFSYYQTVYATDDVSTISTESQVQSLLQQIENLKKMIANLALQKQTVSDSYLVVDVTDNSIIAEKNSNKVYPIASVTKLMNAVVAVENIDMNKTIMLNSEMLKPEGYSPSLFLNLTVSAKNLLYASLIQSTNDAANSLTYFVGSQNFINLMNQKARELGMDSTYYYDPDGLSPNDHSTASDLVKLLAYIYKNHPEILSITKEDDFWLPDPTGRLLKFKNVNNFYANPDFIGAKTGYIKEAKQTLASLVKIDGKPIAMVLLHSANRQTDALKIVDWVKNNTAP